MNRLQFLSFAFALLCLPLAHADVDVRVGVGGGCATASIQTAINGALPVNGITNILIARNQTYLAQHLDINGRNVNLIGGFADCFQALPDSTKTVINGTGGSADTVITVRGSTGSVGFYNLEVTGGDEVTSSAGRGGGFTVAGGPHAQVYFNNVLIDQNNAGYGGGIYIDNEATSSLADVFVLLGDRVSINGNYGAYGGGGVWCRNSRLSMIGTGSFVIFNSTSADPNVLGPGGGIRAQNCEVDIASTGLLGSVALNTAGGPGGGISITGERSSMRLYTQDPNTPTSISNNTANGVGGGIDIGSSANVTAWDVIIDGNRSYTGGGGVAVFDNDDPPNANFLMRGTLIDAPDFAVNCAASLQCNRMAGNQALDASNTAQDGAALLVAEDAGLVTITNTAAYLFGTRLESNSGFSLIKLNTGTSNFGDALAVLNGALVRGNDLAGYVVRGSPGINGTLTVEASTIADNTLGGAVIRFDARAIELRSSIVWQPGAPLLSSIDGNLSDGDVDYLLSNDLSGVPVSTHNIVADPVFQDPANGDYHLANSSPAIDFAPLMPNTQEADRLPRSVDLEPINNEFGPQDLGAFERQFVCDADTIFCDGFDFSQAN